MPPAVTPKEHSLTGDACFRRTGVGPRPPTRGEPRSTRVPLSQPFRGLLQSLADRHESELAELQRRNRQLTIENERLSSSVRQLRRQTAASNGSIKPPAHVLGDLGDTDVVQLPKRSTRQVGWADQAKQSRGGTLRRVAACEDSEMEVLQLPGEIESLPERGGGPEPQLPKVIDEGEDQEVEDELEQLPDDDVVSMVSMDSSDHELVEAIHAKRRIGMMLLSGGTGMLVHAFHAWSTLRGTARFTKRGPWDPSNASVVDAFREAGMETPFQVLGRSMSASIKLRETVAPAIQNSLDYHSWVIPPGSNARIVWDLLCMVLLAYDVVMIPVSAFDPDQSTFMDVMDRVCMLFWSGDMIMSCLTGFVHKGVAVMQPRRIILNYLRTWFLLDLLTVGPDWVFELIGSGDGTADREAKMLRAFRMIRIARLLRLAKLQRVFSMLRDRIDSEIMFVMVNIAKLLLMLLVVNHVLAAAWYSVGSMGMELGIPNWIENQGFNGLSLGYRYSTSLHWSITQFTPGSMAVQPFNSLERSFAITCLIFGLVIFSSFVSSITAAVTQLKNLSDNKAQQFWLLRRYLRQHGIDRQLFFRILRYADYACRERNDLVTESRLWVLQLLSEELRNEVQYQVSFSCLRCLPLFEEMRAHSTACVHQLVNRALGQRSLASRDVLFNVGTPAAYIYVIVSGELSYLHNESCDKTGWEAVGKEDWLCEPAFWTNWMHMGAIQAHTETKIVSIEVASFLQVVTQDKKAHKLAAAYSHFYLAWLNRLPSHQRTDVSRGEIMGSVANHFLYDSRRVRKISELGAAVPA